VSNRVVWKGESRNFCTSCGSIFSSEAIISEESKSDVEWYVGAPSRLGEYWLVLSHSPNLPVRGDVWVKQGQEVVSFGQKETLLAQLKMSILYHMTFVLPRPPSSHVDGGCTGSD
jgi:hypothetical protein